MKRQAMTDGSGSWFDIDNSECFDESSDWNGSNNISRATGSQTEHEQLYRTKSKKWVLNSWSNWQGTTETWEIVSDGHAAKWLAHNEYMDDDRVKNLFQKEFAELEL